VRGDLPSGTVTFLFTDVEGSTRLLHELGADGYAEALIEHRRLVREACAREGGVEVDTQGDAFFFAFPSAPGAISAADAFTEALASGRIRVRVGLHTGTPLLTDEGYVGDDVHRAARIAAAGHGGQVLVSAATAALLEAQLQDLGEHRLKDLSAPERIFQLGDGAYPPLKSLYRTNLPIPATPFLGRERELHEVVALLSENDSRLLTLTGPGGTGKTRLAAQAAGLAAERYPDGVWWIPLAPLRDPLLVLETAAQVVGSKNGVAEHVGDKSMLLLFDNFEQVVEASADVASLLGACPRLDVLVTSREPLRVTAEQEYPVPPLVHEEGVGFFLARARAVRPDFQGDEAVSEICRRLDDLPLALELAAARVKALSSAQLLERLDERLPLLTGGARDLPERQRTLRATIEWSYDLLAEDEQRLFRALSVFAGGCTLEAAEEVADARLDTLQSLVEKSLLRFSNERYWMLETIHEYARGQLRKGGESAAYARRHASHYLAQAEEKYPEVPPTAETQAWYGVEVDNLRAMLEFLLEAEPSDAARATHLLFRFWKTRGAYAESRQRLGMLLDVGDLTDEVRADALARLAEMRERLGDLDGAEAAAAEALTLSAPATNARVVALLITSSSEILRGNADEGMRLARLAVHEAEGVGAMTHVATLGDLGAALIQAGRLDEARSVIVEATEQARREGLPMNAAWGAGQLGVLDLIEGDYESARHALTAARVHARSVGYFAFEADMLRGLGYSYLGLGRRSDARATFGELLQLASGSARALDPDLALALCGVALAVEADDLRAGARLRGAIAKLRLDTGVKRPYWRQDEELERRFEQRLIDGLGDEAYATELANGARMSLAQAVELARSLADS
jgi:predicted ATPase/class 3 adenylate cyclase/Flp pilus assembly protein TadD